VVAHVSTSSTEDDWDEFTRKADASKAAVRDWVDSAYDFD